MDYIQLFGPQNVCRYGQLNQKVIQNWRHEKYLKYYCKLMCLSLPGVYKMYNLNLLDKNIYNLLRFRENTKKKKYFD